MSYLDLADSQLNRPGLSTCSNLLGATRQLSSKTEDRSLSLAPYLPGGLCQSDSLSAEEALTSPKDELPLRTSEQTGHKARVGLEGASVYFGKLQEVDVLQSAQQKQHLMLPGQGCADKLFAPLVASFQASYFMCIFNTAKHLERCLPSLSKLPP